MALLAGSPLHCLHRPDQPSAPLRADTDLAGLQWWVAKILGYDLSIINRPGTENQAANTMSRVQYEVTLQALAVSFPYSTELLQIEEEITKEPQMKQIKEGLTE